MHSSRMRTARSSNRQLWEGGLPQCMQGYIPPGVGLETPSRVWAWRPPQWVWAWKPARHAGIHPPLETCKACWDTTPPPVNRMSDRCKNITLPQTSFAGGNNVSSMNALPCQVYFKKTKIRTATAKLALIFV